MKRRAGMFPREKRAYASPHLTQLGRLKVVESAGAESSVRQPDGSFKLQFPGADFIISEAGTVARVTTPQSEVDWRKVFEERVLPMLLSLRGEPVFHGGAVERGGHTIALLGPSGRSTSILTAAFVRRGHAAICGDFLHLDLSGPRVEVQPPPDALEAGWEEIAAGTGEAATVYACSPRLGRGELGRGERMQQGEQGGLPLSRVYVLRESDVDVPAVRPVPPPQQLRAWTSNAFVADVQDRDILKQSLAFAARLVGEVPMRRVEFPPNYEALDDVVDAVLADLAA